VPARGRPDSHEPMEPITNPLEALPPTLLPPAMGEQCTACGSLLARDQRYCLECGERNGEPRLARMSGRPVAEPAPAPPPAPPPRRLRGSAGTTLVAGVGVLLLALGVGVEIGRSSGADNTAAATPPVRVVTMPGAGTAAAATVTATPAASTGSTAATTGGGGQSSKGGSSGGGGNGKKSPDATPTPTASPPPPSTVKIGQKGHGAGYKNGKFTGDFFGGG
jgi:hypothetical protein